MIKYLLYFVFITVLFSSCISTLHEDIEYLNKNERAFLNYSELLQLISNDDVIQYFTIDISKYNTIEKINVYIDTICHKYEYSDTIDLCWDFLAIKFNYEDNSFKPNKDENYNVNISSIAFACQKCCVTFKEMEEVEIEYKQDTIFINNYSQNIYDTILTCNKNIVENKLDSIFNKKISQFLNIYVDYKNYEQTDEIFNQYIDSLDYNLLNIRLSISKKDLITEVEPLFTMIYKSYLKTLNQQIYNFTKHKIEDLTINEMKLFGKNISLYMIISQPFYEIFLNQEEEQ